MLCFVVGTYTVTANRKTYILSIKQQINIINICVSLNFLLNIVPVFNTYIEYGLLIVCIMYLHICICICISKHNKKTQGFSTYT